MLSAIFKVFRRPFVCENCDSGNHGACLNVQACLCAFRGHQ
jgi:hypothetical protein